MASKQKVVVHLPWYPVNSVILCFDLICARLPSWASQKSRVFQLRFYWPFPTRAASHTPHYKQLNCKRECISVANWNNIFLIKMHIHTRYISLYCVLLLTPVIPGCRVFLDKFMAAQVVKNPPLLYETRCHKPHGHQFNECFTMANKHYFLDIKCPPILDKSHFSTYVI